MDLEAEELCDGVEELDVEEGDAIAQLLTYIPLLKGKAKVPKDPDSSKFRISILLLLEEIVFEGVILV